MSAAAELQKAVFARLVGDAALTTLLGGPKVVDRAPADVAFPYVSFGRASAFDWSTATETGSEHLFTLNVWSKAKGRAEALAIMERIRALLHDAALALGGGYKLVNLRFESADMRYDDENGVHAGAMRLRAVVG